jgi:hypothetical protein
MAYEFKLPDLGEGLTEGEVARRLVAGGVSGSEPQSPETAATAVPFEPWPPLGGRAEF